MERFGFANANAADDDSSTDSGYVPAVSKRRVRVDTSSSSYVDEPERIDITIASSFVRGFKGGQIEYEVEDQKGFLKPPESMSVRFDSSQSNDAEAFKETLQFIKDWSKGEDDEALKSPAAISSPVEVPGGTSLPPADNFHVGSPPSSVDARFMFAKH